MNQRLSRHGFSLIELMVSISVTGVLMMVAVGWIHQTMKCASLIKQRQRHHQNLTLLGGSLRSQVRECKSLAMDGADRLTLAWEDGTKASYTITGNRVDFEKTQPQINGDEPRITREVFKLSARSTAAWNVAEMPNWISLVVSRRNEQNPSNDPTPVDLHVRVAPNRWGQWSPVEMVAVDESESVK
jgi:prepilin-type N-terminal cleavage/methylation domain-containing protein